MSEDEKKEPASVESHPAAEATPPASDPPAPTAPTEEIVEEVPDAEDHEEEEEIAHSPKLKELLQSSDSPSRYLAILSILFSLLAVISLILLVTQYLKRRHAEQKPAPVIEKVEAPHVISGDLGEFKIDWGNADLRVQIVAECSTPEACDALKARLPEARDLTLPLLQGSSRDEILNPDKKLILRKAITEKLNEMKSLKGKVTQVQFTDLSVEIKNSK